MSVISRLCILCACALGIALLISEPVQAACQVVVATASSGTKSGAIERSRQVLRDSAADLKRKYRWKRYSIRARKVKGDTFWKAVRQEVPPEAKLPPDVRTREAFTTCWTGVVVPIVCTSGGLVCGN